MRSINKGQIVGALACTLLIALIYGKIFYPPLTLGMGDPDRYFHLRLAQMTAQNGLIHELPQVDGLGWKYFFPDKEFLLHWLSGLAYSIGGEWGTLTLVPIIALLILGSLYFTASSSRGFKLPPFDAALVATFTVLGSSALTFRLFLLRPHLLGILFWLLLTVGFVLEIRTLVFFGSILYALSYHAFYMPILSAAVFLIFPVQGPRSARWKLAALAPAGLILGSVLNPYFPGNIAMGWTHLRIALGIGMPVLNKGEELDRVAPLTAAWEARWQIGVVVVACILAAKRFQKSAQFRYLFGLCLALGLMYFLSPRTNEYWIPACGMLLAAIVSDYSIEQKKKYAGVVAVALSLLISMPDSWNFYEQATAQRYPANVETTFAAISKIPPGASGALVFNCNWSSGAQIFYARPDLRFIDLLEPALLYFKDPDAHRLREAINRGAIPSASDAIKRGFGAKYVICDNPILKSLLEKDSRIRVLGPNISVQTPVSVAYEIMY